MMWHEDRDEEVANTAILFLALIVLSLVSWTNSVLTNFHILCVSMSVETDLLASVVIVVCQSLVYGEHLLLAWSLVRIRTQALILTSGVFVVLIPMSTALLVYHQASVPCGSILIQFN